MVHRTKGLFKATVVWCWMLISINIKIYIYIFFINTFFSCSLESGFQKQLGTKTCMTLLKDSKASIHQHTLWGPSNLITKMVCQRFMLGLGLGFGARKYH